MRSLSSGTFIEVRETAIARDVFAMRIKVFFLVDSKLEPADIEGMQA
jgi:hypothetical protein